MISAADVREMDGLTTFYLGKSSSGTRERNRSAILSPASEDDVLCVFEADRFDSISPMTTGEVALAHGRREYIRISDIEDDEVLEKLLDCMIPESSVDRPV